MLSEAVDGKAFVLFDIEGLTQLGLKRGPATFLHGHIPKRRGNDEAYLSDLATKSDLNEFTHKVVTTVIEQLNKPKESMNSLTPGQAAQRLVKMCVPEEVPVDSSKEPGFSDDQVEAWKTLRPENAFVATIMPHLQDLFPEHYVVNSEKLKWEWSQGGNPDLFISKCYQKRKLSNPTTSEQQLQHENPTEPPFHFGIPYNELLDSLVVVEAKVRAQPHHLTQLYNYVNSLPAGTSRGMLFHHAGFTLLEVAGDEQHKTPTKIFRGQWSTRGCVDFIQAFFKDSLHDKLLDASLQRASAKLKGFLGKGGFGRVYHVSVQEGDVAMKIVTDTCKAQHEVRLLKAAKKKGCPVVTALTSVVEIPSYGGYYLLTPVGHEVSVIQARSQLRKVMTCLHSLHRSGVIHGDARIRNLIMTNDETMLWIDFLGAGSEDIEHHEIVNDIRLLVKSLGASDRIVEMVSPNSLQDPFFQSSLQQHLNSLTDI